MGHFTVVCLVLRPSNESKARVGLVLVVTSLLFLCNFLLISMRTASLTLKKLGDFFQNKVTLASLSFKGQAARHNSKMVYCGKLKRVGKIHARGESVFYFCVD